SMDALLTSTYLDPEMHILTLRIASRHIPEAGAVCGSSARTDLCGGAADNCHPYRDRFAGPRIKAGNETVVRSVHGNWRCEHLHALAKPRHTNWHAWFTHYLPRNRLTPSRALRYFSQE